MAGEHYKSMTWTPERVLAFWDYQASRKELYFGEQFGDRIIARVKSYLSTNGPVLDYGCGTGGVISHLLTQGFRTAGCDSSRESMDSVNTRFGDEPGFLGAEDSGFFLKNDYRFDNVLLIETIEHLDDDILLKVFREIRELLRVGGVLVITTPNSEVLSDAEVFCPSCRQVFHKWQHVRSWNSDQLKGFVESQGFAVRDVIETDFSLNLSYLRGLLNRMKNQIHKRRPPHLALVCERL